MEGVSRLKKSKEVFYNKICLEMYNKITKFVRYYVHDERIIDDIVQETFIEAYNHIDELVEHPNYKGWLYNTAKYKAKNICVSQQRRDCLQVANVDKIENAIYDNYEDLFFLELKKKLRPKDYHIIELKFKYGYTYEEIAKSEQISVGACKMRMNRIIKKLRADKISW